MSNYPPGAKYDSNAPYNQEEPDVDIYISGTDEIIVSDNNNSLTIDEYDISFFVDKLEHDSISYIESVSGGVNLITQKNNIIFLDNDEIIDYFYSKI